MTGPAIPITGDVAADMLLQDEPLALLIGMLLDQQVPMEWAFRGPATLKERLGGSLDATRIASMSEDDVVALCEALGIERPVVLGQSFGGFVAQRYAARHPGHPSAIVLSSTAARVHAEEPPRPHR